MQCLQQCDRTPGITDPGNRSVRTDESSYECPGTDSDVVNPRIDGHGDRRRLGSQTNDLRLKNQVENRNGQPPADTQGDNRKVPESRKAQQQQEKRNTHDGKPHEGVGTFFIIARKP